MRISYRIIGIKRTYTYIVIYKIVSSLRVYVIIEKFPHSITESTFHECTKCISVKYRTVGALIALHNKRIRVVPKEISNPDFAYIAP